MIIGIAFLLIGFGWILQYLGFLPADLDLFWPVFFIGIGAHILWGKDQGCWGRKNKK